MKIKRAIDSQSLFFYIFFSLPLVYIFDYPVVSRTARFSVLFGLLLLVFCIDATRRIFYRNILRLSSTSRAALALLAVLFILSTVFSQSAATTMLFGTSPEYIGLVSWTAFIVLGILFSDRLNDFLTTKTTLLLSLLIGGLSFATSIYEVFHGLRIPGLMLQATTMGMYAVCLGIIGLWQLRLATTKRRQLSAGVLIVLSTAIVIFTQSRIAVMAYVLSFGILAIWMTWANKKQRMLSLLVVALVMTVSLLPHVFTGYFARFQADSVGNGTHYRLELYKLTATDVLNDNRIIGYGPGSLPDTINDESKVPEDIQLSLAVGDVFLSSHDMYLDIGYCFGLVAALIILVLSGIAFVRPLMADTIPGMELWCLFLVGIINALFNVTSLELTPWYFLLLFPLLADKTRRHA